MNPDLIIAIINLVTKVGFDAAIAVIDGLKNAATLEDAIAALQASKNKTWADYVAEAKSTPGSTNPTAIP